MLATNTKEKNELLSLCQIDHNSETRISFIEYLTVHLVEQDEYCHEYLHLGKTMISKLYC